MGAPEGGVDGGREGMSRPWVSDTNAIQEAFERARTRHHPRRSIKVQRARCWARGLQRTAASAETIAAAKEGLGSNFVGGRELGNGRRRCGLLLQNVRTMCHSIHVKQSESWAHLVRSD